MPATDGVCAFLTTHVSVGMVVLDIGANEGVVTDAAAGLVGPTGRVIAYEPFPASADAIATRHRADAHVDVIQAAVSDVSGEAMLYLDGERSTRHSLWPKARLVPGDAIHVTTTHLDAGLATLPPVDVIKIDAQGAEARIVRGGEGLLSRDQPLLIFELWRKGLKVSDTDGEALLNRLASLGYHFHPLNGKGVLRSDGRIRTFLATRGGGASLNVVAHPRAWPSERWRHSAAPAACVNPPARQATCRPWVRTPKPPKSRGLLRRLWTRVPFP